MMKIKFEDNKKNPGQKICYINSKKIEYISYNYGETAIVLRDKNSITGIEHLILQGDFTEEYEKCKSIKDIIKTYKNNYKDWAFFTGNVDKYFN